MIQKVTIDANPRCTRIIADGKEIEGVRRFKCEREVGQELPLVTLEIIAREVEFVGTAVTEIEKPAP